MAALRAVGFDLDGTLFDHRASARAGVERFFRDMSVEPSGPAMTSWFVAEDEQFERWRSGAISFQEQRRQRLRDVLPALGIELHADTVGLDDLFARYLSAYRASWRLFPDSRSLLRSLRERGFRVGLLTNGTTEQQTDKLTATGLDAVLDAVCVSETIGSSKPDAQAFLTLAAALGVAPSECLFVGDDTVKDVAGARSAGMRALLIDRDTEDSNELGCLVMRAVDSWDQSEEAR